jgi:hypothetical protein
VPGLFLQCLAFSFCINPHVDCPWQRVGVVEGLVLAAMLIWVPVGLSRTPLRGTPRAWLAQALLFLAATASLLIVVILSGSRSAWRPVASAYCWLLVVEFVIGPLGFFFGCRLRAIAQAHVKPKKPGDDDLAAFYE